MPATCGRGTSDCRGGFGHAQVIDFVVGLLGRGGVGMLHEPGADVGRGPAHLFAGPMRRLRLPAGFAGDAGVCRWRGSGDYGSRRGPIAVAGAWIDRGSESWSSAELSADAEHNLAGSDHFCPKHACAGGHSAIGQYSAGESVVARRYAKYATALAKTRSPSPGVCASPRVQRGCCVGST